MSPNRQSDKPGKQNMSPSRRALRIALICIVAAALSFGITVFVINARKPKDPVINENVVVWTKGDSDFDILASDSDSVTLSSLEGLDDSTMLSSGVSDATPNGCLRHLDVSKAEQVDGGWKVPTTQAALTEAIEYCDLTYSVLMDEDGNTEVVEGSLGDNTSASDILATTAYADTKSQSVGYTWKKKWEKDGLSAWVRPAIEVALKINNGKAHIKVTENLDAGFDFDGKEGLSVEQDVDDEPLSLLKDKTFTIMAGPVPLVFTNDVSAKATIGASLNTNYGVHAELNKTLGFQYTTGGKVKGISEDRSKKPTFDLTANHLQVLISASMQVDITWVCKLYGVAGISVTTGPKGEITASLGVLSEGQGSSDAVKFAGQQFAGGIRSTFSIPAIEGSLIIDTPKWPVDGKKAKDIVEKASQDEKKAEGSSEEEDSQGPPWEFPLFDASVDWVLYDYKHTYSKTATYTTESFTGMESGGDFIVEDGAQSVVVPSLSFDYPFGTWYVENDTFGDSSPSDPAYATLDLVNGLTGERLKLTVKAGNLAGGVEYDGNDQYKVLADASLDGTSVVYVSAPTSNSQYSQYFKKRLCLIDNETLKSQGPVMSYAYITGTGADATNGLSVAFGVSDEDLDKDIDINSDEWQEIIDIIASIRYA